MLIDGLYDVRYKDNSKAVIQLSDKNHPVFKAHFPQKPIMPGFIHFEIISNVFALKITTIKRAKFLKLIEPNQILTYEREDKKFQVFYENEIVASFVL
ncbi:MAG: hypothetical protein L3J44_09715 [Campylobacteraceae bacterium]|nr:hypothetical protein [Campylobacteraceae bacterium]